MSVTWHPENLSDDLTLSGGNLISTNNGSGTFWGAGLSSRGQQFGKWYWEVTITERGGNANGCVVGISLASADLEESIGAESISWGYWCNGEKMTNNSGVAFGDTYDDAAVIGIALDMDAGKVWFSLDDAWQDSGDPAAGTGEAFDSLVGLGPMYASFSGFKDASAPSVTANFGASAFAGTKPTGFSAYDVIAPTVRPSGQRGFTSRSAWRHKR